MTTTNDQASTTLQHRVGARGRLTLRQSSGEIAVKGVEGDTIRVRSLDGRSLSDLFSVELGDDFVELRQVERVGLGFGRSRREGAELAIEVPHGAAVSINTQSADITASDLSGEKTIRTASGEVTLTRLAGAVEVETVSGEIELNGQAPVSLTAKSVSGDVQVRVPSTRELSLGTTSGDIRLDAGLTGEGPFAIRTISGDVTIVGRGGFRVEAETITGDMSSDLPSKRESMPGRRVLTIGRPGPTLSFRSVSGDFHVAAPRDAAPEEQPAPSAIDEPSDARPERDRRDRERPDRELRDREVRNRDVPPPDPETARLEILRELERGRISVAEATDRLSTLDEVLS
jgi:hypothetical protein